MLDEKILEIIKRNIKDFDENIESDFLKVDNLSINNRKFDGKYNNIDLKDLYMFKNLRVLSLQDFKITTNIIKQISEFPNLKILQLTSCQFISNYTLSNNSLESIYINNCTKIKYKNIYLPNTVSIIGEKHLNIKQLSNKENIKHLALNMCNIVNIKEIMEFINLKDLNIDGSTVDNENILNNIQDIEVSKNAEYLPIA